MAAFKIKFQFTLANNGFSETYYRDAGDINAAGAGLNAVIAAGIRFRNALVNFQKITVSDVANTRNAYTFNVNRSPPFSNNTPAVTSTALVYTLVGVNGGKRQVWLRGLDQNWFGRAPTSGADRPDGTLLDLAFNYFRQMYNANFRIRVLAPIAPPVIMFQDITTIAAVPGSGFATLTYTGPAVAVGNRVRISQMSIKDYPGLNGDWTALTGTTATTLYIRYNYNFTGPFTVRKGRFRPISYNYNAFNLTLSDWNKQGSRDTGRNPLGGRGRKSSPRIRSA